VTKTIAIAGLAAVALLLPAVIRADEPSKKAGPMAVFATPSDLKWTDVPGATGVKMAVVTGNPAKGPGHFFIKFPAGFSAPEHHHTANHYVAVMQGTMVLGVDGKEHSLPTGSFFSFTGGKKHTTKCAEGGDCVVYIDSRGTWDVVPEAAAAAPAK
jgi:quercetin dioxygenase-like cupin family protein